MAHHGLSQRLLDQGDTSLVDGLTVWEEATLQRRGNRGKTLEQREEIFVFILQLVPLGYQWRHQLLYVLLKKKHVSVWPVIHLFLYYRRTTSIRYKQNTAV